MQALGLGGACLAAAMQLSIPRWKFTLYVFEEVVGFTGAPRVWVNGIGSEGMLYVQETRQ